MVGVTFVCVLFLTAYLVNRNNIWTYAHRISYWLGLTGASVFVDTACSSALFALDQAYKAIRTGTCDNAIVVGCHSLMLQNISVEFSRLVYLVSATRPRRRLWMLCRQLLEWFKTASVHCLLKH